MTVSCKARSTARLGYALALCGIVSWSSTVRAAAQGKPNAVPASSNSAPAGPYTMILAWPAFGDIKASSAIGIFPDGKGGLYLQHRTAGILHITATGEIKTQFEAPFTQAHGLCLDSDGNFWTVDSGPFVKTPDAGVKGSQVFKYSPDGKLLLTLGKAGVSKAGTDTFIGPTACLQTPDGNIVIADGHWPRRNDIPQDGDRLVFYTRDGKFLESFGQHGRKPGEFMGPHALAYDSKGRLFVADRSNNRIQIFDKKMKFVAEWKQFGRPSGMWILKDDTLIVSDSESDEPVPGADDAPEGGGKAVRNPGFKNGIRIGSAKDGSIQYFIEGTRPEGLAADENGNIFGGLMTSECSTSESGGCVQKFVKK